MTTKTNDDNYDDDYDDYDKQWMTTNNEQCGVKFWTIDVTLSFRQLMWSEVLDYRCGVKFSTIDVAASFCTGVNDPIHAYQP